MLRRFKLGLLRLASSTGITALLRDSEWRRRRLLILAYHGISLEDEHRWLPSLYMSQEVFRRRMQTLRDNGVEVLPLDEGVDRLYAGTLPPKSAVLTFDDGFHDFYRMAYPVLREFGYPATVYQATLYSELERPPFGPMCSYLLWKRRGGNLDWPEVAGPQVDLDERGRTGAWKRILRHADAAAMSPIERDGLLAELAERLGIDYQALCARRLLHLMTPGEIRELAAAGIDFQLHTHPHLVSRERESFRNYVLMNQRRIQALGNGKGRWHFCYPSGICHPELAAWLREMNIHSAVTCETALATARSDRMFLPRVLDGSHLAECEFVSWVSGTAALLPRRHGSQRSEC